MFPHLSIGMINVLSFCDTDGVSCSIFFQGCKRHCPGCHNPELQPFEGGHPFTVGAILDKIRENIDWYDCVALVGGEPLDQPSSLIKDLIYKIRYSLGLHIWLYTGYYLKEIPEDIKNLCSVIVAGPYIQELHTGGLPASSNQQVIDYRR